MKQLLRLMLLAYVLFVLVVTGIFFIQQQIVYREHIRAARNLDQAQVRVTIKDAEGNVQPATLQFVDTHVVGAHGRMGNELIEHMNVLLALNLATVFVLAIVCFATMRVTPWRPLGFAVVRGWLRAKKGQCRRCGYDLRGSYDGIACPECGTPIADVQRDESA